MTACQTCGHDDDTTCYCNAPIVCPGCHSVGEAPCASDCIDAAIARDTEHHSDDEPYTDVACDICGAAVGVECAPWCEECVRDDSTECACSRCLADDARWESWQGWGTDESMTTEGDET